MSLDTPANLAKASSDGADCQRRAAHDLGNDQTAQWIMSPDALPRSRVRRTCMNAIAARCRIPEVLYIGTGEHSPCGAGKQWCGLTNHGIL